MMVSRAGGLMGPWVDLLSQPFLYGQSYSTCARTWKHPSPDARKGDAMETNFILTIFY